MSATEAYMRAKEGGTPDLVRIRPQPIVGRLRLTSRWGRFMLQSLRRGDWDYARNAVGAVTDMVALTARDALRSRANVECNICGWQGRRFYPNSGPGYDERDTLCPGCRGLNRHRTLLLALQRNTRYFAPGVRVIEVAPMRGMQALCRAQPHMDYTSFDLSRFAMERGDITRMRYESDSVDYFTCFHVLEHIPDEAIALAEIRRVLKPGGVAVLQVPVDWSVAKTYEYAAPDPREVGHVRRYGRDFRERIQSFGFEVAEVRVAETATEDERKRYGLSDEPVYLASKPRG